LGIPDANGRISLTVRPNYYYAFDVIPFREAGWEAYITDSGVENGVFGFTVELTKEGKEPIIRKFQISNFTRTLYGNYSEENNKMEVFEISDQLGAMACPIS